MSLLRESTSNIIIADQLQAKNSTSQDAYLEQLTYSANTSTANYVLTALDEVGTVVWAPQAGGADIVDGPPSATDNAVCRFDGTTGKLLKDSANTILTDAGELSTDSVVLTTGLQLVAGAGVGNILQSDVSGNATWQAPTQVIGPSSATDNAVCRFDGTTGELIKDSAATLLTDAGELSTDSVVLTTGLQLVAGAGVGNFLQSDVSGNATWQTPASAAVSGPLSATDNAVCRFDGTTGELIKDSAATFLTDAGKLSTDSIVLTTGLQLTVGAVVSNILKSGVSGNATWQSNTKCIAFTGTAAIATDLYFFWGADTAVMNVFNMPYACNITAMTIAYSNIIPFEIDVGATATFTAGTLDAGDATIDANFNPILATRITLTDVDDGTYPSVEITGLSLPVIAGIRIGVRMGLNGVVGPLSGDFTVSLWFDGTFS